ncbi:MAG: hypothetical protein ACI4UE_06580 [Candidatus Scatovivens sp.]
MTYNEFETKSLGKLKILAHIDNRALLEKMYDTPEKYIIATNFNIETKSWDFGSYYYSFQDAIEEFTERVLNNRHIKSSRQKTTEELYDLSSKVSEMAHNTDRVAVNEYLKNQKEMEKLRYEFKQSTINDKKLQEHFKNDKPTDRFSDIMIAGTIIGGIDLRNLQRNMGNLDGEEEKFPYNEEQLKMIDRYIELEHRQEELENNAEEDMEL